MDGWANTDAIWLFINELFLDTIPIQQSNYARRCMPKRHSSTKFDYHKSRTLKFMPYEKVKTYNGIILL